MKTHTTSVRKIQFATSVLLSLIASPLVFSQSVSCENKQWNGTGYVSARNKVLADNVWLSKHGLLAVTDIQIKISNPAYFTGYACLDASGYICKDKMIDVTITQEWFGASSGNLVVTYFDTESGHVSEAPRFCPES